MNELQIELFKLILWCDDNWIKLDTNTYCLKWLDKTDTYNHKTLAEVHQLYLDINTNERMDKNNT